MDLNQEKSELKGQYYENFHGKNSAKTSEAENLIDFIAFFSTSLISVIQRKKILKKLYGDGQSEGGGGVPGGAGAQYPIFACK